MTGRFGGREPVLVLAATAVTVLGALVAPGTPVGATRLVAVGLLLAQGIALSAARRSPVAATAVVLGLGVPVLVLVPQYGVGLGSAALFVLAVRRTPRISGWGLGVAVVSAPLAVVGGDAQSAVVAGVSSVAAWSLGELVRTRRLRRAAQVALVAEQERAALAREVHDIVGHSLATIIVQAGAAEDVFDERPDRSRESLRLIDASARAALDEVRATIDGCAHGHGLGDLPALAARLGGAGPRIELEVVGDVDVVAAETAGSVYRIVQESLTNVLRHSAAQQVRVRVGCGPTEVRISVDDDGPATSTPGEGSGLRGMRARAALHGGSLTAGATARGGFRVAARLPIGGQR